tara:strand:+ start:217 stop:849 length:633 start_codon:yes stop_codon:yes gene_type:complete
MRNEKPGKLAVVGTGGHAQVVFDTALQTGWSEIVFFDEKPQDSCKKTSFNCSGSFNDLIKSKDQFDGVIVAIGDNEIRLKKTKLLINANAQSINLVHPRSYVANNVIIGKGSVVFAGSVVQPNSRLGIANIINSTASVDHDCEFGDGVHICPGAHIAGNVKIGDECMVGVGSSIINGINLGEKSKIGAGSVVIRNVTKSTTVVGVPAFPV